MQLTRYELICGQDRQLSIIGVRRENNPGWLQDALRMDFTPEKVSAYHAARKATKGSKKATERPPKRVREAAPNQFYVQVLRGSDGHWVAMCKAFKAIETGATMRNAIDRCTAAIEAAMSSGEPEDFANQLFESSGRDLG